MSDIATALSLVITRDGQSTPTGNIPLGGFILTGMGAGSGAGHSIRYEQVFVNSTVTLLGGLTVGSVSGVFAWPAGTKTAPGMRTAASSTTGFFSDTANTIQVSINDTEVIEFNGTSVDLTCGQLKFPATQVASSNANTLDDYEEGTWTPILGFATAGDASITLSLAVGSYRKIGSQVIITCDAVTATFTHTTASGEFQVTGLPFNSANTAGLTHSGAGTFQGITNATFTDFAARLGTNSGSVLIGISRSGLAITNVAAADMPSLGTVITRFTLPYSV